MAESVSIDFTGFDPVISGKVMRLLLVLDRINAHPFLQPRLCLHGGTALNLFTLDMPRLSVDIDLNYIGSVERTVMLDERPEVERAIVGVGNELGFHVIPGLAEHSGRSFRLQYQSDRGADQVKIDVDYLNRSPLLPPQTKTLKLPTGAVVSFSVNRNIELFAGKTKALLERVAVRDLYDISKINAIYSKAASQNDEQLWHRIMLYYLSVSDPFPRTFEVANRFAGRDREVADALYPMLLAGDRPTLAAMIADAETFIKTVSQPTDEAEAEYWARAARADFAPELLFGSYPDTLAAARADPVAAWKMQNLTRSRVAQ